MTTKERVATELSQYDDPQLEDEKKSKLLVNLKRAGMDMCIVK